jgi:hypothetical protein
VDFVSTVAQNLLSPENDQNIHGKTARKLGGILKGGSVVHLAEPHYLLTPDQYDVVLDQRQEIRHPVSNTDNSKRGSKSNSSNTTLPSKYDNNKPSSTRSSIAAHATSNYLQGISRESKDHPLATDLPPSVKAYLGEKYTS